MRTRAGYWIGAGLLAIGAVGAVAWLLTTATHLVDRVDAFQHVGIPGGRELHLEQRKYVLYVEGPGVQERVPALRVAIVNPLTETPLPVARYSGSLTYDFNAEGSAVATVVIPRAGVYEVTTSGPDGYRLAIGESIAAGLVRTVVGALLIGGVFGIAGILLLIVTGVRRSRAPAPRPV